MIAFPAMLVGAAKRAGMDVPEDPENFKPEDYPHFDVFCVVQLERPVLYWGEHWDNAEVIAGVEENEIRTITFDELIERGLVYP